MSGGKLVPNLDETCTIDKKRYIQDPSCSPTKVNNVVPCRALIGEEERLGGGCTGPQRGEELFVQVLGHVHYLPANWRGRAHTKDVAAHFQQLFQFRAVSTPRSIYQRICDKFL